MTERAVLGCAGVFAEKVLLEKTGGERKNAARGVAARTTSTAGAAGLTWRLVLRANTVVAAAGSLHTPALLLRSKLSVNGNVGRHLRLHPATAVTGAFAQVCMRGPPVTACGHFLWHAA
jgi:long-chain-alcohol oxidase